jgi:glycosyltransferase involved in cell wall biosynthesis
MVHEDVGRHSSIARVAQWAVEHALDAGWKVTVVAQQLDESLYGRVEWLRLYKPKRMFAYQWLVARSAIQAALGDRKFDVLHVHQAQVNSLADLQQCHFLTRVAWERDCLETGTSVRARFVRAQQLCVLRAEDYYYRHKRMRTHITFCSDFLRQEFDRLYGLPDRAETLHLAMPSINLPSAEERQRARAQFAPEAGDRIVIGYLGGIDERKGYRRLLRALLHEESTDLYLLLAGPFTQNYEVSGLEGRCRPCGLVYDTASFYAACDVVVMPSLFEPLGMVVFEAAARGVPAIAAEGVGALPTLLRYNAGLAWPSGRSFAELAREAVARRSEFLIGWQQLAVDLSEQKQAAHLLQIYEDILREKQARTGSATDCG